VATGVGAVLIICADPTHMGCGSTIARIGHSITVAVRS